jgi:hypothetical protein
MLSATSNPILRRKLVAQINLWLTQPNGWRTHLFQNVQRCEKTFFFHFCSKCFKYFDSKDESSSDSALEFDRSSDINDQGAELVHDLHLRGVNVRFDCFLGGFFSFSSLFRYLGLVLCHVKKNAAVVLIVVEMVARCVKHKVLAKWRAISSNKEEEFVVVVQKMFSRLQNDDKFWAKELIPQILEYFFGAPKDVVLKAQSIVAPKLNALFERVGRLIGFEVGRVLLVLCTHHLKFFSSRMDELFRG